MPVSVTKPQRIGVLGGTFDPPHLGHLVSAVNVRHTLHLDLVILMVANIPWQKVGIRCVTPAADRLAMVLAAVGEIPGLLAGDHEIRAGGYSYTADTLVMLAADYPGAELFTIIGEDAAAEIESWERVEEVIDRSQLVVVDRPGVSCALSDSIDWMRVAVPHLDVSSSDLRDRIRDGRPIEFLVPDSVIVEIRERRLYGVSEAQ